MTPDAQYLVTISRQSLHQAFATDRPLLICGIVLAVAAVVFMPIFTRLLVAQSYRGSVAAATATIIALLPLAVMVAPIHGRPDREQVRADVIETYGLDGRALPQSWLPRPDDGRVFSGPFALRSKDGHLWPAGQWFVVSQSDDTFWLAVRAEDGKLAALGTP